MKGVSQAWCTHEEEEGDTYQGNLRSRCNRATRNRYQPMAFARPPLFRNCRPVHQSAHRRSSKTSEGRTNIRRGFVGRGGEENDNFLILQNSFSFHSHLIFIYIFISVSFCNKQMSLYSFYQPFHLHQNKLRPKWYVLYRKISAYCFKTNKQI